MPQFSLRNVFLPQVSYFTKVLTGSIILLGLVVAFWWIYFATFGGKPFISNDGWEIPEYTKLNGKYVDNINYINQHHLGGIFKFDVRKPQPHPQLIPGQDYLSLPQTEQLNKFIANNKENKFWYEPTYHGLFSSGLLTDDERQALCHIVNTAHECMLVNQFFITAHAKVFRRDNAEVKHFIEANRDEINQQSMPGYYFHHQYSFFGAINEINLKRPIAEISFLYGWLNTITLAAILKYVGSVTFTNYLKLAYLFYPLYYSLIAFVALLLFRNFAYAIYVTVICMCSYFLIGYESIHLAPGFIPIRHFFDLFVLAAFYFYVFAERKQSLYLVATLFFTVLSYLCSKEFGLFIFMGVFAGLIFKYITERRINLSDIIFVLLSCGVAALFTFLFNTKGDPTSIYTIAGAMCPGISPHALRNYFLIFNLIYILFVFVPWRDDRWKIVAVFLFAYAETTYIYYVWNPSTNHWYSIVTPWIFLSAIMLREVMLRGPVKKFEAYILFGLLACLISYHKDELNNFYLSFNQYKKIFTEHKTYDWNMPTAQFVSTMDPAPFEESIKLIQKYVPTNGIYIISKYDNLIPFLAGKYSLMPYEQVALSLVTEKEINNVINTILQQKPNYLFVDSDIQVNHRLFELSPSNLASQYTLRKRMLMLNKLYQVFKPVSDQYKLVAHGQLISVYQRELPG